MNPWRNDAVPLDGTEIVAIGRVLWHAEESAGSIPFVDAIRWAAPTTDFDGWVYSASNLAVGQAITDEVKIDWWLPMPDAKDTPTRLELEWTRAMDALDSAGIMMLRGGSEEPADGICRLAGQRDEALETLAQIRSTLRLPEGASANEILRRLLHIAARHELAGGAR